MIQKHYLILLIAIFILAACSERSTVYQNANFHSVILPKKQAVSNSFIPRSLTIVALGDSLTRGVGDSTKNGGYLYFFTEKLLQQRGVKDISITNFAKRGDESIDLLTKLTDDEVKASINKADMIIITIGGNDIMKVVKGNFLNLSYELFEQEEAAFEKRLRQIVEKIRETNQSAEIILVGLYNPFLSISEVLSELDNVIENWNTTSQDVLSQIPNTTFVKVDDIFKNSNERLLSTDEFHPNVRGYELMGERIFEYVRE